MTNKNLEQKFPEMPSLDKLIKCGAIPIKDMTHFKLEINGKIGMYKPLEKDGNENITYYALKNIFSKKVIGVKY